MKTGTGTGDCGVAWKSEWKHEQLQPQTSDHSAMEILLIRIDHFADRKQYLSILRTWLSELHITQGRIITMGALQLLFIVSTPEQNTKLLEFYATKNIDINSRQEVCECM